jgi:cyclase
MLKTRIIPTMLWKGFGLVKGQGFDSWRPVGSAMQAIKVYNMREVDELVLLDISATGEGRGPDLALVDDLADECFMPLTVGGGVRSLDDVHDLLHAGADKVVIGTRAITEPALVRAAADRFGSQCVVASLDVCRAADGSCAVLVNSGAVESGRDPVAAARAIEAAGAGEILLQSVDRDGTLSGYDVELIRSVAAALRVPVIASGGAGTYDHLVEAVRAGASAVAAAAMFHFTQHTPLGAKRYLAAHGFPVRT